uniref:ATP synthase F0 subunit 8 n=1 Tax=Plaxiphora tricolor TaxID=2045497 RepID=UPI002E78BC24|nr:ATP synthase F0 subunit 8 [Plaxiphora tricolor]WRI60252.1 ATP synthase F0 subunit 8 [Plaxiphora tricolor]
MPQLAPLNWITLFIVFWMSLIILMIMIWWMKDKKYMIFYPNKHTHLKNTKWMW